MALRDVTGMIDKTRIDAAYHAFCDYMDAYKAAAASTAGGVSKTILDIARDAKRAHFEALRDQIVEDLEHVGIFTNFSLKSSRGREGAANGFLYCADGTVMIQEKI